MTRLISNKFYEIEEEYRLDVLKKYMGKAKRYKDKQGNYTGLYASPYLNKLDFNWVRIPHYDNMQPIKISSGIDMKKAHAFKIITEEVKGKKVTKFIRDYSDKKIYNIHAKPVYSTEFQDLFNLRLESSDKKGIDEFIIERKYFKQALEQVSIKHRAIINLYMYGEDNNDVTLINIKQSYIEKGVQHYLINESFNAMIKILCDIC